MDRTPKPSGLPIPRLGNVQTPPDSLVAGQQGLEALKRRVESYGIMVSQNLNAADAAGLMMITGVSRFPNKWDLAPSSSTTFHQIIGQTGKKRETSRS